MNKVEKKLFDLVRSKLSPQFLREEYQDKPDNPYYGHCHHASLALWVLLGGKEKGYKIMRAVDDRGISHYWIESPSKEVIDPTVEQYIDFGKIPPHDRGKGCGANIPKSSWKIIRSITLDALGLK